MNERLKEIKEKFYKECTNASYSPIVNFHVLDIMGLIEIAEQQQEEIERYKKALGKIVADGTYYPSSYSDGNKPCYTRAGEIAKKSLVGEPND